jgi:hypothetical protein
MINAKLKKYTLPAKPQKCKESLGRLTNIDIDAER